MRRPFSSTPGFGDDGPAPRMTDQDRRPILPRKHAPRGGDVIGKRRERFWTIETAIASAGQIVIDAPLRGQDLNLRPSGYEPDELPGCSTPRGGRWPAGRPRDGGSGPRRREAGGTGWLTGGDGWWTWRRPTLPRLGTQYHGRGGVSRPSSGWDRVGHPRYRPPGRATSRAARSAGEERARAGRASGVRASRQSGRAGSDRACKVWHGGCLALRGRCWGVEVDRAIRTGQLRASPRFHTRPIDVVVYHGSDGETWF